MQSYIEIIKIALVFFPFLAFFISFPFILMEYHKYGSISFFKTVLLYSFVFYLLCAYFLVILPLPKISEVALLSTPRMQLVPFKFVRDFMRESSFQLFHLSTYLQAIKEKCFYVPVYNILLTLPFGMYLHSYFNVNVKKTVLYSFLLSLFFELTQLSGLYFIYPRGYRLFDVDDLLLNTLGGLVGYSFSFPFLKLIPNRKTVNEKAKEKGKVVSSLRRTTSFCLDFFFYLVFSLFLSFLFNKESYAFLLGIGIYYLLLPILLKGSTIGEKFLNIQVVDLNGKYDIYKLVIRKLCFLLIYLFFPILVLKAFSYLNLPVFEFFFCFFYFLFAFLSALKFIFTKKTLLYERLSKTKLKSTIK